MPADWWMGLGGMPRDWWTWLGVLGTVVSLSAFLREKRRRRRQADVFRGFIIGIRSHTKAQAQAGEEWRYNVGKGLASPQASATYANSAVNGYLAINKEIEQLEKALEHL
jgi:hypothetical protein